MWLEEARKTAEGFDLAKELFIREAKLHICDHKNQASEEKFTAALGNSFQLGNPIEIIDGNTDTLEKD